MAAAAVSKTVAREGRVGSTPSLGTLTLVQNHYNIFIVPPPLFSSSSFIGWP